MIRHIIVAAFWFVIGIIFLGGGTLWTAIRFIFWNTSAFTEPYFENSYTYKQVMRKWGTEIWEGITSGRLC